MAEKEVKIGKKKVWEGLQISTNLKTMLWFIGIIGTLFFGFYTKLKMDIKEYNKDTNTAILKVDEKVNTLSKNAQQTALSTTYMYQIIDVLRNAHYSQNEKNIRIETIISDFNAIKINMNKDSIQPPINIPSHP
jgi:hypothetical protein